MSNLIKAKKGSVKNRLRRGRGNASGLGGEAGRGHKGQQSRSGYSRRFGFEGGQMPLYKRVPKKNGFNNINRREFFAINLDRLENIVTANDVVDINFLFDKNVIKTTDCKIKILSDGELTKKIKIIANAFSKTAIEKIKSSGSEFEIV